MRRVVVIGASVAGVHAVEGLREAGFNGDVTLIDADPHLPYDKPPLSKEALRLGPDAVDHRLRPAAWYDELGVDLRLGRRALAVDVQNRQVIIDGREALSYDGLVLATGSSARSLKPADERTVVHVLRTVDDCKRLHSQLRAGRRLVIIGAGFIGLEVAATAKQMGLRVSVIEVAPVPLARVLGDEVGGWFRDYHAAQGVDVRCATRVTAIEPVSRGGANVHLSDDSVLRADLVVAGVGASPAIEWLRGSGLQLADGVVCDAYLRTSAPSVVAAGDIARWYNPLFDQDMRVEQWTNAVEQGRYAARSLLGLAEGPYSSVPYFWSDQFEARIRFVGTSVAAEDVHVEQADDHALIALFGRDGRHRGALCVNAPRKLAGYQRAIKEQASWDVTGVSR